MFNLILSSIPRSPLTYFLTLHLTPELLVLRSALIRGRYSQLRLGTNSFEVLYWVALVSIPYSEYLDNALESGTSKGGSSLGSYGAKLPAHIEEPSCELPSIECRLMLLSGVRPSGLHLHATSVVQTLPQHHPIGGYTSHSRRRHVRCFPRRLQEGSSLSGCQIRLQA